MTDALEKARDVVKFYYMCARALDYVARDDNFDAFVAAVQASTRNVMEEDQQTLGQMAMMARNTAVHYWQKDSGLSADQREAGRIQPDPRSYERAIEHQASRPHPCK